MKKKIKLFVHPGYGKCGTTFLQDNIFKKFNGITSLSKPFDNENFSLKIKQLNVFQPNYYEIRDFFPKYSFYYLNEYCSEIIQVIKKSKNDKFILSEENILDFFNYHGEKNILLLKELIDRIGEEYEIELNLLISIRKQSDIYISNYSYDYTRFYKVFGDYENFVRCLTREKPEIGLIFDYYKMTERLNRVLQPSKISFFILENLSINPKKEIENLSNFVQEESAQLTLNNEKKNQSKVILGSVGEKKYAVKSNFKLYYLFKLYGYFKKFKFFKHNSFVIKIKTFLKKSLSAKTTSKFVVNEKKHIDSIKRFYNESNQRLSKKYGLDLKKFDYF